MKMTAEPLHFATAEEWRNDPSRRRSGDPDEDAGAPADSLSWEVGLGRERGPEPFLEDLP
jgi:hypothetical protein